jgi:outer membrane lipoprotein-sorting protein
VRQWNWHFQRNDGSRPRWRMAAAFASGWLALCAVSGAAQANGDTKGLEIATKADERDEGFGDFSAALTMTLHSSRGETSVRRMRARILETEKGDKRLIMFDEPGDVRGTSVLTHTHLDGTDDQWIYLPAIKRVKRIAGSSKSGPFMGSEFAYEDLASQELAKYSYTFLRDEPCGGGTCYVIERHPADANSGYRRQIVWIDHDAFRPWRVEYYDRKDALMKVLVIGDYKQYKDRYWRAGLMTMENVQTQKRTVLEWKDYVFGAGMAEGTFDPSRLADGN